VVQSALKLILNKWKFLIVIYLLLKEDFSQDYGLRKKIAINIYNLIGQQFCGQPFFGGK